MLKLMGTRLAGDDSVASRSQCQQKKKDDEFYRIDRSGTRIQCC